MFYTQQFANECIELNLCFSLFNEKGGEAALQIEQYIADHLLPLGCFNISLPPSQA